MLPFVASGGGDVELFGDGLTDELTTALSKIGGIAVIARSSSFAFRGGGKDIRRVAAELGARYVLDGSVRRNSDRIRLTVQLVDGNSGSQSWAERYERAFVDVFLVQDDLAGRIVSELVSLLTPSEVSLWPRIPTRGTQNVHAYHCFLRGRSLQRSPIRTAAAHDRWNELFQEAISLDPAYAAPYAALAMGAAWDHYYRWTPDPAGALRHARKLAEDAIARDPRDAYIRGVAALVAMYGRDMERWAFEVDEALSLDRNFAPALALRAPLRLSSGDPQAAIDDLQRAIRLDPHFVHNYLHDLGAAHLFSGQYDAAVENFNERIVLVPDTDVSRAYLASALGNLGRVEEARTVWASLMTRHPGFNFADRISQLPFRRKNELEILVRGLSRAGLPHPPPWQPVR